MEQTCKNCGNHFRGSFCNRCGQKVTHRLDLSHLLHEEVHVFTHTDKGVFALIPAILFRPGITALEYVPGKRKRHFSIFQYLILVVGLATFVIAKAHLMENVAGTIHPTSYEGQAALEAYSDDVSTFGDEVYLDTLEFEYGIKYLILLVLTFEEQLEKSHPPPDQKRYLSKKFLYFFESKMRFKMEMINKTTTAEALKGEFTRINEETADLISQVNGMYGKYGVPQQAGA